MKQNCRLINKRVTHVKCSFRFFEGFHYVNFLNCKVCMKMKNHFKDGGYLANLNYDIVPIKFEYFIIQYYGYPSY